LILYWPSKGSSLLKFTVSLSEDWGTPLVVVEPQDKMALSFPSFTANLVIELVQDVFERLEVSMRSLPGCQRK
jgi:hypothetical protein